MAQPSQQTNKHTGDAYDAMPYASYPYPETNPLRLQGVAALYGLMPASPAKARILEIGCAEGVNIIGIAALFPHAECVGIDMSARQIETARRHAATLGLSNVKLEAISLCDIPDNWGQFDYIIAHGVLSWVAPPIQEKLMEMCSARLSPHGVAYISFNALPGWHMVRMLRDMMLFHTQGAQTPQAKASDARDILRKIAAITAPRGTPYSAFLQAEQDEIKNKPDAYLLHDHLEENNHAFYLHEFVKLANEHGLAYIADTDLTTQGKVNPPQEILPILATTQDRVRQEQYMDFILSRRFRSALVCRKDAPLRTDIPPAILRSMHALSHFIVDTAPDGSKTYRVPGKLAMNASDVDVARLIEQLDKKGGQSMPLAPFIDALPTAGQQAFMEKLLLLVFAGGFTLLQEPMQHCTTLSARPVAFPLARYQASMQEWAMTQRMEVRPLNMMERVALCHMDGYHDHAQIMEAVKSHVLDTGSADITAQLSGVMQKLVNDGLIAA